MGLAAGHGTHATAYVFAAPKGVDVKSWITDLKNKEGLWLAGGQADLAGKIFRLSHMGDCNPEFLLGAIETIEKSLASIYPSAANQSGFKAADEVWKRRANK